MVISPFYSRVAALMTMVSPLVSGCGNKGVDWRDKFHTRVDESQMIHPVDKELLHARVKDTHSVDDITSEIDFYEKFSFIFRVFVAKGELDQSQERALKAILYDGYHDRSEPAVIIEATCKELADYNKELEDYINKNKLEISEDEINWLKNFESYANQAINAAREFRQDYFKLREDIFNSDIGLTEEQKTNLLEKLRKRRIYLRERDSDGGTSVSTGTSYQLKNLRQIFDLAQQGKIDSKQLDSIVQNNDLDAYKFGLLVHTVSNSSQESLTGYDSLMHHQIGEHMEWVDKLDSMLTIEQMYKEKKINSDDYNLAREIIDGEPVYAEYLVDLFKAKASGEKTVALNGQDRNITDILNSFRNKITTRELERFKKIKQSRISFEQCD